MPAGGVAVVRLEELWPRVRVGRVVGPEAGVGVVARLGVVVVDGVQFDPLPLGGVFGARDVLGAGDLPGLGVLAGAAVGRRVAVPVATVVVLILSGLSVEGARREGERRQRRQRRQQRS